MSILKYIVFLEIITVFICFCLNIFAILSKQKFPLAVYPITTMIILIVSLFSFYILLPFHNLFFKNL